MHVCALHVINLIDELWRDLGLVVNVQTRLRQVELHAVVWHRLDPDALDEVFDLLIPQERVYPVSDEKFLVSDVIDRESSCHVLGQRLFR